MDKRTEVLAFFWDTLLPKAGMQTEARQLLKEKLLDHESYRAFGGAGEVSWMSRLAKSGLETFALIEDLVFGVKFDNQLRKAALTGSIVENVFEFADVKEKWDEITAQLQNEDSERKVPQGLAEEKSRETEDQTSVVILRKGPQNFAQNSIQYWRAVANQTVRTYIALVTEPRTQESVLRAVEQSHVQKVTKGNVLILLDLNLLGESMGPGANELLRKRFNPSEDLLRKLVHGAMLARSAQRKEDDQCTCLAEADFVFVHVGDRSKKDVRVLFKMRGARADSPVDAEEKEIQIAFSDDAMREQGHI